MAETGHGRSEVTVLGHGFFNDLVDPGGVEDLPPIGGDSVTVVKLLGLAGGGDGLSRLRVLGVLGHRRRLGPGEVGPDGAGGEEDWEDEVKGQKAKYLPYPPFRKGGNEGGMHFAFPPYISE